MLQNLQINERFDNGSEPHLRSTVNHQQILRFLEKKSKKNKKEVSFVEKSTKIVWMQGIPFKKSLQENQVLEQKPHHMFCFSLNEHDFLFEMTVSI